MTGCISCGGTLTEVLDLGAQYLGNFVAPGESRGDRYPLTLMLCGGCTLLQLSEFVPREQCFHERYGFRSGINEANRADVQAVAAYALQHFRRPRRWLDIGSNDGTLLAAVPPGTYRAGVDPVRKFARECARHADLVIADYFSPGRFGAGEFDVVTSAAMFYDLENPGEFVSGVRDALAPLGAWVIQQNYALDMLRNNVIDQVIHEHRAHYSVRSLQHLLLRHGLEISDVTYSPVKGGCFRAAVSHRGARPVSASVRAAADLEREARLADPATWRRWGEDVRAQLAKTRSLAERAAAAGQRIYIYGASTRAGTFLQMIGAGPDLFPYAVEREPEKFGKVMTSVGVPIISEEQMRAAPPEYLLVGPWPFRDLFVGREAAYLKAGGRLVFPLPRFEMVGA